MALTDFSIDTSGSPQDVQRKQALADALMKQGMDSTAAAGGPGGGWVTALNRGLAGALGGYQRGSAANEERQGRDSVRQQLAAALSADGKITPQTMIGLASNPWATPGQTSTVTHVADMQRQQARDAVSDRHQAVMEGLAKRAADRADDKTPFGWTVDATGAHPIANGPYDPDYVAKVNAAKNPTARPMTAEERAAYGLPANAPAAMTPEGPKAIGGGNTVINNAVNPALKDLSEQFSGARGDAATAADTIRYVQSARGELDKGGGIIAGAGANERLQLQKVGSLLGVANPDAITNTETFRTQIKPIVLSTVKGLGAGSGISNADREFAEKAAGGDITLDQSTIRRVLDITERAARSKIQRYNKLGESMRKSQPDLEQVAPMLSIDEPAAYTPPAQSKPQTVIQNGHTYTLQPDGSYQ
ncbi:hypothetical protein JEY40_24635 [Bradyrhizobium japonicum]|uniref:hypothetical protein n=1 Tax=Bradyrhizobium japonicum TaxID=375 RepID=UPI0020101C45|nr:hypothetical protein [Bradyrhizobium japonicum]UQD69206.1 hypothetical protein JEY40_24635 [Bradyrhizobium japonicum]WAX24468.1 hypothetical protein [Bradyrhizobium phage ppBjS10J-1]